MDFKFHMQHLPVVDIRGLVNVVHRKCGLLYRYIYPYVAKVRNRGEGKKMRQFGLRPNFFQRNGIFAALVCFWQDMYYMFLHMIRTSM